MLQKQYKVFNKGLWNKLHKMRNFRVVHGSDNQESIAAYWDWIKWYFSFSVPTYHKKKTRSTIFSIHLAKALKISIKALGRYDLFEVF